MSQRQRADIQAFIQNGERDGDAELLQHDSAVHAVHEPGSPDSEATVLIPPMDQDPRLVLS